MLLLIVALGMFPNILFHTTDGAVHRATSADPARPDGGGPAGSEPMTGVLLAATTTTFKAPYFDYHALAPEIVLTATIVVVLVVDLMVDESKKYIVNQLAGLGMLGAFVPIVTLAAKGISGHPRVMFGGAYVVDVFSLVFKALFLAIGYVVLLMGANYIEEGDYYEGEFVFLILSSLLGMLVISSSRDLIGIFIALELLSIPAYMLAGWRKRDLRSNEASLKYYLLGVLATGVMLYGMSLIFGATGTTLLTGINQKLQRGVQHGAAGHHRHLLRGGRLRLQGLRGAVPLLGARHLRGGADTGRRLLVGGVQDGRVRRPARTGLRRLPRPQRRVDRRCSGSWPP